MKNFVVFTFKNGTTHSGDYFLVPRGDFEKFRVESQNLHYDPEVEGYHAFKGGTPEELVPGSETVKVKYSDLVLFSLDEHKEEFTFQEKWSQKI